MIHNRKILDFQITKLQLVILTKNLEKKDFIDILFIFTIV